MKLKLILVSIIILTMSVVTFSTKPVSAHEKNERMSGREGSGGDEVAENFTKIAKRGLEILENRQKKAMSKIEDMTDQNLEDLKQTIKDVKVFAVTYKLCKKSNDFECPKEKGYAAKNYPRQKISDKEFIFVNTGRWNTLTNTQKVKIALHEYFGIIGLEIDNYNFSSSVILEENTSKIKADSRYYCQFTLYEKRHTMSGPYQNLGSFAANKGIQSVMSFMGSFRNPYSDEESLILVGLISDGYLTVSLKEGRVRSGQILNMGKTLLKDQNIFFGEYNNSKFLKIDEKLLLHSSCAVL